MPSAPLALAACVAFASAAGAHPGVHDTVRGPLPRGGAAPCPYHPPPTLFNGTPPAAVAAAVDATVAALAAVINATSVPGLSFDVLYGRRVLTRGGLGVADRSTGAPVRPDTLFRIGSVTKAFVAVLAFRAASLGLLSLDDPVVRHVPGFRVIDPFTGGRGADITFRHLVTQRSGLPREVPPGVTDTAGALSALGATYLIAPPGARPSYSNLGFALLGHVLAEYVFPGNATLESLLEAHITGPLGLTDTGTEYTPAVLARLAPSYDASGARVPFAGDLGWLWPAGSMYASAQNLTAFGAALLDGAADDAPVGGGALGLAPPLARELLDVTVLLPDGVSLVSAPWESTLVRSYVVRNKGGELVRLAIAASWNGLVAEAAVATAAVDALIPAMVDALAAAAPPPDRGPAPGDYEGVYAAVPPGAAPNATVHVGPFYGGEYLLFDAPGYFTVPLAYAGPSVPDGYRMVVPPGILDCVSAFKGAFEGAYVLFGRDAGTGRVTSVAMHAREGPRRHVGARVTCAQFVPWPRASRRAHARGTCWLHAYVHLWDPGSCQPAART